MIVNRHAEIEAIVMTYLYAIYKRKIEPIIDDYNALVDEYNSLEQKLRKLRADKRKQTQKIKDLKQRIYDLEHVDNTLLSKEYYQCENKRLREQNVKLLEANKNLKRLLTRKERC